jgi:hypothetical protein
MFNEFVATFGASPCRRLWKRDSASSVLITSGGLPETMEAFQRVLRSQKDWEKIGSTIENREGKLGDDEWQNTKVFLRWVAQVCPAVADLITL